MIFYFMSDSSLEFKQAQKIFLKMYPQYKLTALLDRIRKREFSRLDCSRNVYADYMGGSLYPRSLIRWHSRLLKSKVFGNSHSVSPSSALSTSYICEARTAVLSFFDGTEDYTVIFTPNATGALKLVGEAYPFAPGGHLVLAVDSHNSVNGIRQYARKGGATVSYLGAGQYGGFDEDVAKTLLSKYRRTGDQLHSLFVVTGQSNISGHKPNLDILQYASRQGFHTLLDAAALAPSSAISLRYVQPDAMVVSFYKMYGYPTGVGALIIKKDFLHRLKKPWFSGGTVEVVQVPGDIVTEAAEPHERFEEGTLNYLALPVITQGLRFLEPLILLLPLRLSILLHHLHNYLSKLHYPRTHGPVFKILSRPPDEPPASIGIPAKHGFIIALLTLSSSGSLLPNSFIEHWASIMQISVRTGCVCNPGGAAALLGLTAEMAALEPGVKLSEFEKSLGRELGVVRISLGLGSSFRDVHKIIQFGEMIQDEEKQATVWEAWTRNLMTQDFTNSGHAFKTHV